MYLAAVLGVLLASMMMGGNEDTSDFSSAGQAEFYITLLSVGYMISRGLAPYTQTPASVKGTVPGHRTVLQVGPARTARWGQIGLTFTDIGAAVIAVLRATN